MNYMIYATFIFISIFLVTLASYALAIFMKMKKEEKHKTDYFALFVFGIIWIITSLIMKHWVLSLLGLIPVKIGYSHKKDWKKNKMNWSTMKPQEKASHIMLLVILFAVIAVAGSVWWFSVKYC